ncbi:twin-arginine translocation signal domain-containing protein [Candidatus Bathyarchaeota archaeon]|nr:MAG: twin-arginine translocation signal domain-containing protein [Candidatus Bathyarchaeota archaeon]
MWARFRGDLEKPLRINPGHVSQKSLKQNKNTDEKTESERDSNNKISRRDFLKFGVGAAAVAAGGTALMGKIPIPAEQPKTPAVNDSAEPIVASVSGDQLTVMSGQVSVKVKDAGLAAQIADKLRAGS